MEQETVKEVEQVKDMDQEEVKETEEESKIEGANNGNTSEKEAEVETKAE